MWLSGTTAGQVIYGFANEPYAPVHLVYLGVVTRKNPTNGQIFIRISNGWELDELHNVNINHANTRADKDILQYDSATSLWKNTPLSVTTGNIVDGTIVNSDINASAGIDSTKISGTAVTQADTGTVTNAMLAGSITNGKLLQPFVTVNGTTINLGGTGTVTATTTNSLGLTSGGNLSFSSGTTWNGGTAGVTIGLSTTPTGITSINSVTMPTSGSFITSATTSLPNVTSVNGTSIPSSATLVRTTDLATTTVTGIASFDSGDFSVTAGAVVIKSAGVDIAQGGTGASTAFAARTNLAATTTGAVHTGTVAPTTNINVGDYWLDPNTGNLFVYYTDAGGGQWIQTASGLSGGADIRGRVGSLETRTTAVEGVNTTQNGFLVPTGCIMQWATNTPPSGWLLCDGQSTSGYAALASIVGASVPDLRGRVPVGRNSGTFATLGATGGAETHTLSTAEIPAHSHQQGHAAAGGAQTGLQASGIGLSGTTLNYQYTGNTGGGGAHNNLQPYIVLNYIIKT
jgi:microcystin-dependent protein